MNNQINPTGPAEGKFSNGVNNEIDELLKMARRKKFKPGIYNFCDRWCERCKDKDKCFLYAWETQRRAQNIIEGKDDNWLDEIKHNFEITKKLIERSLKEEGIDPRKALKEKPKKHWDDNVDKRYDKFQCLIKAREYMKEVADFLDNFHKSRYRHYPKLGLEVGFEDIKDEIETISWYHTFLPMKVWRTLYEKESWQRERDRYLKNLIKKDFKKFCLLVMKCLDKSISAWRNLGKKRKEFSRPAKYFLVLLEDIKQEFKNETDLDTKR